jgi:hypothetical protein
LGLTKSDLTVFRNLDDFLVNRTSHVEGVPFRMDRQAFWNEILLLNCKCDPGLCHRRMAAADCIDEAMELGVGVQRIQRWRVPGVEPLV